MRKVLKIYNSLSGKKEVFKPLIEGQVRMYVCGMTVYDYCHIGHARVMVAFDVIARHLRDKGYRLTYVRNITDVDDKIFKRAKENAEPYEQLTARFIEAMHEDEANLGCLKPDIEPRATAHMEQIIALIETLIAKGYAYQGDNKDVYYRISQFAEYGKLSKRNLEDLRAGERVEVDAAKENPLDFVLWKAAKPGEAAWES
ncbi:MAG: class I tRNA ligase family protein, partial [Pseudomonadales bacterium]|nr:class I tRNA ligase family protein [Pseudomonadales bacterium]